MSKKKSQKLNRETVEEKKNISETTVEEISENVPDKRKIKEHRVLSAVFTAAVLAGIILLNVVVGMVSERFGAEADLTATGLYTLDEKTEDYLENTLACDISIKVLSTEQAFSEQGTYFKQVREILQKMEKKSAHVSLDFVDLTKNPTFASKYTGVTLSANNIIVENAQNGRYKVLTQSDYFGLDNEMAAYYYYYYGYIMGSSIEQAALSAMLYVSNDNPVKVAFLEGFNESDSSTLKSFLSKNGYEVEAVNLAKTLEIDESFDFAVVYAPLTDYDESSLKKLDKFLDNGGKYGKNVYYFASTSQPKTPNIDAFLSDWGIEVGFSVIGQSNADYRIIINGQQTAYAHLQEAVESSYTGEYDGYMMGADLRPVYALERSQNTLEVLLKTYSNAFLFPLDADKDFDFSTAETGVFNDVIMSSKTTSDGTASRVCAIGSDQLSGSYFFAYGNAVNSDFFLDLFDSVSGKEKGITISPKAVSDIRFEMTASTANVLVIILCAVIPTAVIVLGIVIWVRRRHR
ncbi:MAG: GldG family protein [Oscillospiraceae bacterium]|nr:GldG family protein [Oscillospiraceae bacterium]